MRIAKATLVSAVVAALLTACGGSTTAEVKSDSPAETSKSTPAESSAESDSSSESSVAKFGATYQWTDGLEVTVSTPEKFTPSEYVYQESDGTPVVFEVTVVNGTGEPVDLDLFYVSAQSGETESTPIFDSANGIEGSPSTKLLDGRTVKFKEAFAVADPEDIVVDVSPNDGFFRDGVLYSS